MAFLRLIKLNNNNNNNKKQQTRIIFHETKNKNIKIYPNFKAD